MPSVLITGANRGIGLEFARQYAAHGWDVIATARQSSAELGALGVRVETLDLSDVEAVVSFAERIDIPLDLFIANAGTNHPMNGVTAKDGHEWAQMMLVNAISPFMLASSLLSRLADARGKAIAISSGMGSIEENGGGWIPYRTSKAALNMAWTSLALEARSREIIAVVLSPGWVKTRMGGAGAEITSEESVSAMRELIERLTLGETGRFLRRDGSQIPW
jgi:NAD(P)-dependent dehydrogenase (short-subunit alcohol dehydrogenase family)